MLQWHFRDLHPKDFVVIPREGFYPHCELCTMQCNPLYLHHIHSQVCQLGAEQQMDSAATAALALRQLIYVKGKC